MGINSLKNLRLKCYKRWILKDSLRNCLKRIRNIKNKVKNIIQDVKKWI